MNINAPALPPTLIHKLRRSGHILPAYNCQDLQDQELQSLARLRLKSQLLTTKFGYLNAYDRLFRHISLALLAQGYRLTDKQPHQTLRAVAELQLDTLHVTQMIALRHQLKKTAEAYVKQSCADTLAQLLASYESIDPQACQKAQTLSIDL